MKRMYITLIIIFLVMVGTVGAISQITTLSSEDQTSPQGRQPFDRQKRRMELREEMHRRMRAKLLNGIGPDQDLFKDMEQAFEESMSDSFTTDFTATMSNFKSVWKESKEGRVLVITPQSKDQKLNIDVNQTVITIKGESVQKTATTSISSQFTNSFPVPDDCDGTKVKMNQKDGSLLVELPFKDVRKVTKPLRDERKPLPPSTTEGVEI